MSANYKLQVSLHKQQLSFLMSHCGAFFVRACNPVAYLSHCISATDDPIAKFSSTLVFSGLAFVIVVAANTTLVPVFGLHWKTKLREGLAWLTATYLYSLLFFDMTAMVLPII